MKGFRLLRRDASSKCWDLSFRNYCLVSQLFIHSSSPDPAAHLHCDLRQVMTLQASVFSSAKLGDWTRDLEKGPFQLSLCGSFHWKVSIHSFSKHRNAKSSTHSPSVTAQAWGGQGRVQAVWCMLGLEGPGQLYRFVAGRWLAKASRHRSGMHLCCCCEKGGWWVPAP